MARNDSTRASASPKGTTPYRTASPPPKRRFVGVPFLVALAIPVAMFLANALLVRALAP